MQRQVIQSFQGQTQTTSKLQMLFLRRPVIADQVIWIHQAIQDSVRRLKSLHTRRRRYTVLDVTSAAFFLCFLKQHRLDNNSLFSAERINSRTDGWCELRTSLCSDFLFPFSIFHCSSMIQQTFITQSDAPETRKSRSRTQTVNKTLNSSLTDFGGDVNYIDALKQ